MLQTPSSTTLNLHQIQTAKLFYSNIPKSEREAYLRDCFRNHQQNENPSPRLLMEEFPMTGYCSYGEEQLYYHAREQTNNPTAIIVHFHGFHMHGGHAGYFARIIAQANPTLNVYAFDQLNFGRSTGPFRAQITSLKDSAHQGQHFIDFLLSRFAKKPQIYLAGASFGGTIVTRMVADTPNKFSGAILLSPALRDLGEHRLRKLLGLALGWIKPRTRVVQQNHSLNTKYNLSKFMATDTYRYTGQFVAGSVRAVYKGMEEAQSLFSAFSLPYLAIQSGVDKVIDPFAVLDLEERSPSPDKTSIFIPTMWHALFFEEEIETVAQLCAQWLKKRIPQSS